MEKRIGIISPSQVIQVAQVRPSYGGEKALRAAALGRQWHSKIVGHISRRKGLVFSGFEGRRTAATLSQLPVQSERRIHTPLNGQLILSTIIDLTFGDQIAVEIKPGPKLRGRYLLHILLNCMALSSVNGQGPVHGVLYFYRNDRALILKNGGSKFWKKGERVCVLTKHLLAIQSQLDHTKKTKKIIRRKKGQRVMPGIITSGLSEKEITHLNNQVITLRREFDRILDGIVRSLGRQIR